MAPLLAVSGRVVGSERVIVSLKEKPARVMDAIRKTIRQLGFELEAIVKTQTLAGQVLHRQSGDLARSVNTQFIDTPTTSTASTGTNKSYGRAWQLGFHGVVLVKEHIRKVASRNVHARVATITKSGRISSRKGARIAEGITTVREHTMRMNMDARPFLTIGLDMIRPRVGPAIQDAVNLALRGP